MSLRSLSDHEILSRIKKLTSRERSLTLLVLLHLNEIERRRLHLKLGYSSMFDYCTSGLGYSASAASRRIRTARCVARFPQVYGLLESNDVNISTIAQVSGILTPQNQDEVLARIRGKSQREVESIVAGFEPRESMPRDRVRTVVVRVRTSAASTLAGTAGASPAPVGTGVNAGPGIRPAYEHDRNGCTPDARDKSPACPEELGEAEKLERRTLIQFAASESFMAKLELVKSIVWHRLPANASLEQVFELALDMVIEREDPFVRRSHRERKKNEKRLVASEAPPLTGAQKTTSMATGSTKAPRHISAAARDSVYVRDKGRCTFIGSNGRRCESTRALQVDHIKPVAFGGAGTPDNLRLLCAYHNRVEAERLLGSASRRDDRAPVPG